MKKRKNPKEEEIKTKKCHINGDCSYGEHDDLYKCEICKYYY